MNPTTDIGDSSSSSMSPVRSGRTIVDLFRVQVRQNPGAIALEDQNGRLTYSELDLLSNRLANHLLRSGLLSEGAVGILMDCSREMIVALIGILKAGGCCLPIDPESPESAITFFLQDTNACHLITVADHFGRFDTSLIQTLEVDEGFSCFMEESEADPFRGSDPEARAYIFYTSGTTGRPKGSEIEHRSLSNLTDFHCRYFQLNNLDRVPLIANTAFDASVGEIWPTLCAGATLLIPKFQKILWFDAEEVLSFLTESRASLSYVTPAVVPALFSAQWPITDLRFLYTGGDQLRHRPPASFPCPFYNGYGPTENTVFSTWSVVSSEENDSFPPIGKALDGVFVYVLDEDLNQVPTGEEGEIYLGGRQVARGYLNLPELTAERFLPDPFSQEPQARMYRTGDWGRFLPDGELEFLGRRDHQVQLGGIRIELNGITSTMMSHPAVKDACCRPVLKEGLCVALAAHVAFHKSTESTKDLLSSLRIHLCDRLHFSMIPTRFHVHESLPATSRGKVDLKALDAMVAQ